MFHKVQETRPQQLIDYKPPAQGIFIKRIMETQQHSALLFWSAQFLSIITLTAGDPTPVVRKLLAIASALLLVVSIVNQFITLYKNAKSWRVTITIKSYFTVVSKFFKAFSKKKDRSANRRNSPRRIINRKK